MVLRWRGKRFWSVLCRCLICAGFPAMYIVAICLVCLIIHAKLMYFNFYFNLSSVLLVWCAPNIMLRYIFCTYHAFLDVYVGIVASSFRWYLYVTLLISKYLLVSFVFGEANACCPFYTKSWFMVYGWNNCTCHLVFDSETSACLQAGIRSRVDLNKDSPYHTWKITSFGTQAWK